MNRPQGRPLGEHIAFGDGVEAGHYGNAQHLEDACGVLTDRGLELEAGPARPGISRAPFVFVLEPGGNRIELVGNPANAIKDPSWEPVRWEQDTLDSRHPRAHADDYIAAEAGLLL